MIIIKILNNVCKKYAAQIAVNDLVSNTILTYEQLNRVTDQMAFNLYEHTDSCSNIAIFTDNKYYAILSMLAILKIGCVYVPVYEEEKKDRIVSICKQIRTKIILTTRKFHLEHTQVFPSTINVIYIENLLLSKHYREMIQSHSSELQYIMYTSGTTGEAKGVQIKQSSVKNLCLNQDYIKIEHTSVVAQTSNLAFDASTFEVWGALLHGATLFIVPKEQLLNFRLFQSILEKNKVTHLWLTASLFNEMINSNYSHGFEMLDYLLVGGSVVLKDKIEKLIKSKCYPKHIINGYGPTENTTFSLVHEIDKDHIGEYDVIPIGYPIKGVKCYVLNEDMEPVSLHEEGILYLAGEGLSPGYINDHGKHTFIKNPIAEESKKYPILFKSNDLVVKTSQGYFFKGRADSIKKINGFRINLDEIANVIAEYSEVVNCYVDVIEELGVVAIVEIKVGFNKEKLRSFMKEHLPPFMHPRKIEIIRKMPLNQNGKIESKKLISQLYNVEPDKSSDRQEGNKLFILRDIISTILLEPSISFDDNLFDLGCDSILLAKIVNNINKKFNKKIEVIDLFEYTTVRKIATLI